MAKTKNGTNGSAPAVAVAAEPGDHEQLVRRDLALHDAATAERQAAIAAKRKELEDALVSSRGQRYPGTIRLTDELIVLERELQEHIAIRSKLEAELGPARAKDAAKRDAEPEYLAHVAEMQGRVIRLVSYIEAGEEEYGAMIAALNAANVLARQHGFRSYHRPPDVLFRKGFFAGDFARTLWHALSPFMGGVKEASRPAP